jgi:hypothetical protein
MKKTLMTIMALALILMIAGCSQEEAPEKTEEALRAEIKAELEAEMAAEENPPEEADEPAGVEGPSEEEPAVFEGLPADDPAFDFFNLDVEEMESQFGPWKEKSGYLGSDWYIYDDYSFAFGLVDENDEYVYRMTTLSVNDGTAFMGVMIGEGLSEIKAVLGTPANEYLYVDEEGMSEWREGYYTSYEYHSPEEGFRVEFYSKDSESPTQFAWITRMSAYNQEEGGSYEEEGEAAASSTIAKGLAYYAFNANEKVAFDLNGDGMDEMIEYLPADEWGFDLTVSGYGTLSAETVNLETDGFSIVRYEDPYQDDFDRYVIGILEYGPSDDLLTRLYAVINAPDGSEAFVSIGSLQGELVAEADFDFEKDFDTKAFAMADNGFNAPVRMTLLPFTCFGRTQFIYNTTDARLTDAVIENNLDYVTRITSHINADILVYDEKDTGSNSRTITGGQEVTLAATDNVNWVYLMSESGESGWVEAEQIRLDIFEDLMDYLYD